MRLAALVVLLAAGPAAADSRQVTLAAPTVVLGDDAALGVKAGESAPARWVASLGTVDGQQYRPGERRVPGFAIVAAAWDPGAAAAVVGLVGRGALPTRTDPGATVTVQVAGRTFGPVTADKEGNADVPVEVPPGVEEATVTAKLPDGRTTVRKVPLPVMPYPLALVIAPPQLGPGDKATIIIFAIRQDGRWRGGETPIEVRADAGLKVSPAKQVSPGRWEARIEAPAVAFAPGGKSNLVVAAGNGPTLATTDVELVGAPVDPEHTGAAAAAAEEHRAWRRAHEPFGLAVFAGMVTASPLTSGEGTISFVWPLRKGPIDVGLFAEVGIARGAATYPHGGGDIEAELTQVRILGGGRLRFPFAGRFGVEIGMGFGPGWGFADTVRRDVARSKSDLGVVAMAGAAFTVGLGPGEIVADARYMVLHLADATQIPGNALGFGFALGYRWTF